METFNNNTNINLSTMIFSMIEHIRFYNGILDSNCFFLDHFILMTFIFHLYVVDFQFNFKLDSIARKKKFEVIGRTFSPPVRFICALPTSATMENCTHFSIDFSSLCVSLVILSLSPSVVCYMFQCISVVVNIQLSSYAAEERKFWRRENCTSNINTHTHISLLLRTEK